MPPEPLRLLILGAHPDDAEYHAGGLATIYRDLGHTVKMVSVTNGGAGHHWRHPDELVLTRRQEATAAGKVIGAEYITWDFPDGALLPTLDVRAAIIREIRTYAPDLVLTHRTSDYHPDHRAVGQAVQDASYMVTVPLVVPEVPILERDPVVAYMVDLFTRPCPLRADVVLSVDDQLDSIVAMLACHESQVFEFLPYNHDRGLRVPTEMGPRLEWLRNWYLQLVAPRAERFRQQLVATLGESRAQEVRVVEAYEISEYAAALDESTRQRLFPSASV
ncbi:MAG: PIG-L family deacetylase [Pirellulales bacterium]